MTTLFLDTETYSECNLKRAGVYRYAQDPSTEVTLLAWAVDDEPVRVWDRTDDALPPAQLAREMAREATTVVMHNSAFDRTVLRDTGLADISASRIHDTMIQAYCHGLPGGLDMLCDIYKLPKDLAKMKEGRKLLLKFCKPIKRKRVLPQDAPEEWERFMDYAGNDVAAMRELYNNKLPRWNYPDGPEYALWLRSEVMNDRGFAVDLDMAHAAMKIADDEREALNQRTSELTDGEVDAATQRDKLLEHLLEAHGVTLPDLQGSTLERRLGDPDLPEAVKEILRVRLMSSRNTAAKYVRVIDCNVDGRLMGTTQFAGASRTLRDAGRLFQHQNLSRPTMWHEHEKDPEAMAQAIEETVSEIKTGVAPLLYDDVTQVLGSCIRSVIVAPKGRILHAADLSNIEGRTLSWLADETWKLEYFRDYDAGRVEYDNYVAAYAAAMGVDPETVTGNQRAIGKVLELAMGYEGGVPSFINFANVYGLDLDALADAVWEVANEAHINRCAEKFEWAKENGFSAGLSQHVYAAAECLKQKWREGHPATVKFWAELKDGYALAVHSPGKTISVGKYIKFLRKGSYLRMRLPSGKSLTYINPFAKPGCNGYFHTDPYTRKWDWTCAHGGKLAENAASGTARDVLFHNLQSVEDAGYEPVFRVHDEVVAETDDGYDGPDLSDLIAANHDWCPDLPLAADGFTCTRYRK